MYTYHTYSYSDEFEMIVCHFTLIIKSARVIKQTFPVCMVNVKHSALLNAPTLSFVACTINNRSQQFFIHRCFAYIFRSIDIEFMHRM